jgi:hypothetical protein
LRNLDEKGEPLPRGEVARTPHPRGGGVTHGHHRLDTVSAASDRGQTQVQGPTSVRHREVIIMTAVLFIIAAVLVIAGILSLVRGEMLWGIVLIVLGLLVGPGGVSIFS